MPLHILLGRPGINPNVTNCIIKILPVRKPLPKPLASASYTPKAERKLLFRLASVFVSRFLPRILV